MQPTVSIYRRPLVSCTVPAIVAGILLSTSLSAQASPSIQMEIDRVDLHNEMTIAIDPQTELSLESAPVQPLTEATEEALSVATEPSPAEVAGTQIPAVEVAPTQDQAIEPIATAYRTKSVFNQTLNTKLTPESSLTNYAVNSSDILIAQDPAPLSEQQIDPGTETQTGSSYFGFGVNLGLSGSRNALTGTSFAVISKIGLNKYLSVRPTFLIRDDIYVTLPLTFDFEPIDIEGYKLGTYVGGGVGLSTGNVSYVRPLLTAGIDLPLGKQFTGNVALNFAFFDTVDIGLIFGVGYNFRGF